MIFYDTLLFSCPLFREQSNSIPIFIVSFNRLSYVKVMIEYFEKIGKNNLIIIDNASTYPPLLDYYHSIPYKVIYLDKNYGHMAFWKSEVFEKYRNDFYVLTDPDVVPVQECPKDFMTTFLHVLEKYPFIRKVGFSLKLDDLPEDSVMGKSARKWEEPYYSVHLKAENLFVAPIDTTFALYIPDSLNMSESFLSALRTGYPYQARHLPWYRKSDDITEEDVYYAKHKISGQWNIVNSINELRQ